MRVYRTVTPAKPRISQKAFEMAREAASYNHKRFYQLKELIIYPYCSLSLPIRDSYKK
jgi:hypothetical protein